ncbi:Major facilitator superfamily MFS_1 [Thermobacillus xylanilyticus]|uniref:Major facilitator superfamily MFS_1 n=1 Tax=Thermobacillus xylanilyticus TaxID=76633 RepID=A0ABM8UZG1_THEXY|nr:MFS transporter [Thermobacillus xylanilyticus]CAG5076648.1 Major facilitator superfamily MFS_1 [Thermobacillus xylanilyticus]
MNTAVQTRVAVQTATVYSILFAVSAIHMLNDSMQTVVTALFPVLRDSLALTLSQIGWLSFALNMTSSVMQPVVGLYSDRHPTPGMLPVGMGMSLLGIAGLAFAPNYWTLLLATVFIGIGSAVFHPEGSRVVYFAAGERRSFAQSIYQMGGNAGSMLAPLMTIAIFIPLGQRGAAWGMLLAAAAIAVALYVVPWYRTQLAAYGVPVKRKGKAADGQTLHDGLSGRTVAFALTLLVLIVFARSWYAAGINNFYPFYLEDKFGVSKQTAQLALFLYLGAGVAGTFFGGIWGDRFGRKNMIIFSIVGSAPFALALPYLPLEAIFPVVTVLGFIMMSGFSVSVVYAQELMPRNVGMASGLIVGLAFGMGALGAVVLGEWMSAIGENPIPVIDAVSYLPLIGLLAFLLPKDRRR